MNIQDVVPPLELCKLIPEGEFKDSAFLWFSNYHFGGWHIEKRELAVAFTDNGELCPAPTLQEVLEKLPWNFEFSHCYKEVPTEKYITIVGTEIGEIGNTAVESAMLTWLNLKGIKTNENE